MRARFLALALLLCCDTSPVQDGIDPVAGCKADGDCPDSFFCVSGACQIVPAVCKQTSDCAKSEVCADSSCVESCVTAGCDDGSSCDSSSGLCVSSSLRPLPQR